MPKITGVVVKESFNAFGVPFNKGTFHPIDITEGWPAGTLQRRIDNKFLEIEVRDIADPVPEDTKTDDKTGGGQ